MIDFCFSILGEEICLPIYVVGAGQSDEQERVIREDGFPHFQMLFCFHGEGVLKIDGKEHTIRKSQGFFLPPNTPHEYYNTTERWRVGWIVFDGGCAEKLCQSLGFYSMNVFKIREMSKIQDIFGRVLSAVKENNYYGGFRCSVMLYDFLIEMNLQKNNCCALNEEAKTNYLEPVLAFIEEHYNQDLTLEQLSEIVDFTPQYICRLFKESLNLRPFEYIARIRVQHAKDMLLHSDMSVVDIAAQVGYRESSYFCAVFKRYERMSPAEFRAVYIAR